MESYFSNVSQQWDSASSLPLYDNGRNEIWSQQLNFEYNADLCLYPPPFTNNTFEKSEKTFTNIIYDDLTSESNLIAPIDGTFNSSIYCNAVEDVFACESFIPNVQQAASIATSPSTHQTESLNEIFDLSIDEIFKVDDIDTDALITDLFGMLNDVGNGDCNIHSLDLPNCEAMSDTSSSSSSSSSSSYASSASSTPKRKYSIDSSSSEEAFSPTIKRGRGRRSNPDRAIRKKDQNKKAASRYRDKKKNELQSSEQILEQLENRRQQLSEQIKKLRTEFDVILPLAKAAFTFDSARGKHLAHLIGRINAID